MNNEFHTVRGYQLIKRNKRLMTSAMEDYLEMIYRNTEDQGYMRINKLAELLNVKATSATKMVQKLGALGLLQYERYAVIILTDYGKGIGKYLLIRHSIIKDFLLKIGIQEDNPLIETELIEHNISPHTLERISILKEMLIKAARWTLQCDLKEDKSILAQKSTFSSFPF